MSVFSNPRSQELLMSFLTPEQKRDYLSRKGFVVTGHMTGRKYLVGYSLVLHVFDYEFAYCSFLKQERDGEWLPLEDHFLGQKILLETDEHYFLQTAGKSLYNMDVTQRGRLYSNRRSGLLCGTTIGDNR